MDDGNYFFLVADQGGKPVLGAIEGTISATISRKRDEMGTCTMIIASPTDECCALLAGTRTVRNELVVIRNGARVWEGPITRLSFGGSNIELDAADVTWYLNRTVLSEGFDFTGVAVNAVDAIFDVVAKHFPPDDRFNIGRYLTKINSSDDARTAAKHIAYSKTVYELLDHYAEDGGLDYTVNGRRIIIYDTHCRAHVLHKLTDAHFTSDLRVVEYGSQLSTRAFTTNNDGAYSMAVAPQEWIDYYGQIDDVVSNVDENTDDEAAREARMSQSDRALHSSFPAPLQIQVPENSTLDKRAPVGYEELLPGAWVPVEARAGCRAVQQWMRVNAVTTTLSEGEEAVAVSLATPPAKWVPPL